MRIFHNYLFLLCVLGLSAPVVAQTSAQQTATANAFSLKEAVKYAIEHSTSVQNARFDEYISQARVKEVLAMGLPQASISGQAQYFLALPQFIFPAFAPNTEPMLVQGTDLKGNPRAGVVSVPVLDAAGNPTFPGPTRIKAGVPLQTSGTLSITQLIFNGSYLVGLEASRAVVELSTKSIDQSEQTTAANVISAYYTAMLTAEQMKTMDLNIERLQVLFDQTKILNENGLVEKIDVDRLEVTLNNLKMQRSQVELGAMLTKDLLKFQMNMPIEQEIVLTESIEQLKATKPDIEGWKSIDPKKRIEYQLVNHTKLLEQYTQKNIRMGYYPTVAAFANGALNWQYNPEGVEGARGFGFPQALVGIQLSVPVFDGFSKRYKVEQSKLTINKIENQLVQLENAFKLEAKSAAVEYQNAYTNLQTYERNRELAKRVYDVTVIKYKEGVGSNLEVTNAESSLRESQLTYLNTLFSYLQAQVKLEKAKGEITKYYK